MTWKELGEFISKMPSDIAVHKVKFLEPYDDGRQGYQVELVAARDDILIGPANARVVFARAGEPFLE
jgi:hypothetical protein